MIRLVLWIAAALLIGVLVRSFLLCSEFKALSAKEQVAFTLIVLGLSALICFGCWRWTH